MIFPSDHRPRGIALIIVMIVILVLGVLAGGFAYSMKVETRLARNSQFEADLQWMGRSGIELGRYILGQQLSVPTEPWDSLNQKWAGGPMGTNEAVAWIDMDRYELGPGFLSLRITDLERRFNINNAGEPILQSALASLGVDPGDFQVILDSYLDWRDNDRATHLRGAESEDYIRSPNAGFPPYVAKNGPIDDVSELLLIRGITPDLYWGSTAPVDQRALDLPPSSAGAGMKDLFSSLSLGRINVNTAPAQVLAIVPGLDEGLADEIIATRAGPDGLDGTEDDTPFRNPGELINVPGLTREMVNQVQRFFITRSVTFEIDVRVQVNEYARHFVGVVRRVGPRDVHVLHTYWR